MTTPQNLERATLIAWPAERRLYLFGWEHCASGGSSGRVNAVWPLAWTGEVSLDDAIDHAIAWCLANDIAPCFKLADGCVAPDGLRDALTARGFAPENETLVMTRTCTPADALPASVELLSAPDETIWRPLAQSSPTLKDFEERVGIVQRIEGQPCVFARASLEGAPAAIGMGVRTDDLIGIYLMRTAPNARRRGLARQIVRTLLAWGAQNGATTGYLQVEKSNDAAVALYACEGFAPQYSYWYWRMN